MAAASTTNKFDDDTDEEDEMEFDERTFPLDDLESEEEEHYQHHHYDVPCLKNIPWTQFDQIIHEMTSIQDNNEEDLRLEKQRLLTLRKKFIKENLIVRATYKGTGFYVFTKDQLNEKSSEFMLRTNAYECLNEENCCSSSLYQIYLQPTIQQVETTLNDLVHSNAITHQQYQTMMKINQSIQFNYLYFVPETHKFDIPVRPIIIFQDHPTMNIAIYLNELLSSVFNFTTHCQLVHRGSDFLTRLEFHQQCGFLQNRTLFVTFNIDHLSTVFNHEYMMEALNYFLMRSMPFDHLLNRMTRETILQLVRLILDHQYFMYENKLYRQRTGCASGCPLTTTLVYIYLFYWHEHLFAHLIINKELFARYRDEAIITWNDTEDNLYLLLNQVNLGLPQKQTWDLLSIGTQAHFIDVELGHEYGQLYTGVYHQRNFPIHSLYPLPLPDVIQRPIQNKIKWLHKALLRGIRYCSTYHLWFNEFRYLQHLFEDNHFSEAFFDQVYQQLLDDFGAKHRQQLRFMSMRDFCRRQIIRYEQFRQLFKQKRLDYQHQQLLTTFLRETTTTTNAVKIDDPEKDYNKQFFPHYFDPDPKIEYVWYKTFQYQSYILTAHDLLVNKHNQ